MENCIWRPCTQMKTASLPLKIVSAKGAKLYELEGKTYIDANSSWWVTLHGHCHPYILSRIASQAAQLDQVILADCIHEPALQLASQLIRILPGQMGKIFYSDNGSTAVEVALKMALQHNPKKKVVTLKGSYHGDTIGGMSIAGKNLFNKPFWSYLFETEQIELTDSYAQLAYLIDKGGIGCFIYEPLLLGVNGMQVYSPELLNPLLKLCREASVITIADEAVTGFGRLGPLFASELLEEKPDIITLAKGLTGGVLPLGVTACTDAVYAPFHGDTREQSLFHSHSYCGNPLACTSALASIELLLESSCARQRQRIHALHCRFVEQYHSHPKLARCETLGTLLVLEFKSGKGNYFNPLRENLFAFALERGVLFRPLGNVLYVLPPYCISEEELATIYQTLNECLTCIP